MPSAPAAASVMGFGPPLLCAARQWLCNPVGLLATADGVDAVHVLAAAPFDAAAAAASAGMITRYWCSVL